MKGSAPVPRRPPNGWPPPSRSALAGFAELWLSMVYGCVPRDRVALILKSAIRAASTERAVARLLDGA